MNTTASDDQLLHKPIVIVGSARSGTTMLGELFEAHRELYSCVEPRLIWKFGNDRKSDLLRPDDARPEVIAHIRREFAKQVREAGASRLLEKTPSNALRVDFVDQVLPDSKILHIIRNGLDSTLSIHSYWNRSAQGIKHVEKGRLKQRLKEVSLSRLPYYAMEATRRFAPGPIRRLVGQNVWGPRIPGLRGLLNDLELIEVCALQWRMCVESACLAGRQLPSDRYLEIRLEDLSPDVMRQIFTFCELEEDPAVWDLFNERYDPKMASYRKTEADPEMIAKARRWIDPTMRWLGYDTP